MPRVRIDVATTVLAISGVVGALALVGIFIVYLTDNGNSPVTNAPATTTASGTTAGTALQTGGSTAKAPATNAPAGKTATGKTTTGTAPAGKTGTGSTPAGSTPSAQIPANQALVAYSNRSGGYSFNYPQGWKQQPQAIRNAVGFFGGPNSVHLYDFKGPAATVASVIKTLKANASARVGSGTKVTLNGASVITASYTVGTTVTTRYSFSHAGKRVDMDLASPQGVSNQAAFKRVARSFSWL